MGDLGKILKMAAVAAVIVYAANNVEMVKKYLGPK